MTLTGHQTVSAWSSAGQRRAQALAYCRQRKRGDASAAAPAPGTIGCAGCPTGQQRGDPSASAAFDASTDLAWCWMRSNSVSFAELSSPLMLPMLLRLQPLPVPQLCVAPASCACACGELQAPHSPQHVPPHPTPLGTAFVVMSHTGSGSIMLSPLACGGEGHKRQPSNPRNYCVL